MFLRNPFKCSSVRCELTHISLSELVTYNLQSVKQLTCVTQGNVFNSSESANISDKAHLYPIILATYQEALIRSNIYHRQNRFISTVHRWAF